MSLDKVLNYPRRAIDRLILQYRGKPNAEAWANIIGTRIQTLEDAFWDLLTLTGIFGSFGAQLDGLGKILGQPRSGLDDTSYLAYLQAKVRVDLSSGTVPQILAIFALLAPAPRTLQLAEQGPAAFVLRLLGAVSTDWAVLSPILQSAKAAGVRAILEWLNDEPAKTFSFDDAAIGFDDATISFGNAM